MIIVNKIIMVVSIIKLLLKCAGNFQNLLTHHNWLIKDYMYDYTHKSNTVLMILIFTFIFSHLADTFIQTDLQIKSTK